MLVYFRSCERCGARLGEVERLVYQPRFEPSGGSDQQPSAA